MSLYCTRLLLLLLWIEDLPQGLKWIWKILLFFEKLLKALPAADYWSNGKNQAQKGLSLFIKKCLHYLKFWSFVTFFVSVNLSPDLFLYSEKTELWLKFIVKWVAKWNATHLEVGVTNKKKSNLIFQIPKSNIFYRLIVCPISISNWFLVLHFMGCDWSCFYGWLDSTKLRHCVSHECSLYNINIIFSFFDTQIRFEFWNCREKKRTKYSNERIFIHKGKL